MLRRYLSLTRRYLLGTVVAAVLAAAAAAVVGGEMFTPQYASSVTIELGISGENAGTTTSDFAAASQLVATAQALVLSPRVLGPAGERLSPPATRADLSSAVTLAAPTNSLVLVLKTQGGSAQRAEDVLRAVSDEFRAQLTDTPLTSPDGRQTIVWVSADYDTIVLPGGDPSSTRLAASAVLAGILVGLAYLVMRLITDTRIREAWQVAAVTDDSVVAVLTDPPTTDQTALLARNLRYLAPEPSRGRAVGLVALSEPRSAGVVLGLVGAIEARGETAVAVDADLRAHPLGEAEAGLAEYLAGSDPAPLLQARVVAAGNTPPNPAELLERPRLSELFAELTARNDWVIVNCPPVLRVSDTALFGSKLDGVLVVVRAGKDKAHQLGEALAVLEAGHTDVLGIVLLGAKGVTVRSPYDTGAGALRG